MARTVTLLNLRTEIRNRGEIRSAYIGDSELTTMINGSIAELYDLLVSVNLDYYVTEATVTVTSGTATVALSTGFYKTIGVDVLETDGRYYGMERFVFAERNVNQNNASDRRSTKYRIHGGYIRFVPTPSWSGTVRHFYIPYPTKLSGDSDTFDGISGWEEYVVIDCLIKAAAKEQSDPSIYLAQKQAMIERIKRSGYERDKSEPDHVRDVTKENMNNGYLGYFVR